MTNVVRLESVDSQSSSSSYVPPFLQNQPFSQRQPSGSLTGSVSSSQRLGSNKMRHINKGNNFLGIVRERFNSHKDQMSKSSNSRNLLTNPNLGSSSSGSMKQLDLSSQYKKQYMEDRSNLLNNYNIQEVNYDGDNNEEEEDDQEYNFRRNRVFTQVAKSQEQLDNDQYYGYAVENEDLQDNQEYNEEGEVVIDDYSEVDMKIQELDEQERQLQIQMLQIQQRDDQRSSKLSSKTASKSIKSKKQS